MRAAKRRGSRALSSIASRPGAIGSLRCAPSGATWGSDSYNTAAMSGGLSPQIAALMQAVASALQTGDEAGAESALRQLVAENPRQAEAWHMLAGLAVRA